MAIIKTYHRAGIYDNLYVPYITVIPRLRNEGMVVLPVSEVLRQRYEAIRNGSEEERLFWNRSLYTADGIAFNGRQARLDRNSELLRQVQGLHKALTGCPELNWHGFLKITPEQFRNIKGVRKRAVMGSQYESRTPREIKEDGLLIAIAGGDASLLSDYVDASMNLVHRTIRKRVMRTGVHSNISDDDSQPLMGVIKIERFDEGSSIYVVPLTQADSEIIAMSTEIRESDLERKIKAS